jgi:hypothetical protein
MWLSHVSVCLGCDFFLVADEADESWKAAGASIAVSQEFDDFNLRCWLL